MSLENSITSVLLYYDIFSYPLKGDELYTFLPSNSVSKEDVLKYADEVSRDRKSPFRRKMEYYIIEPVNGKIEARLYRERYSGKMWKIARVITSLIKMFPFVRAVMITGSLSKGCSDKNSDLDFMVITAENRLWICRTFLMLFKKIFLFNSYKYFCINYFISENQLEIPDKNIFTATEIATVRIAYNTDLVHRFINANKWIRKFFPNYELCNEVTHKAGFRVNNRRSLYQNITEKFFPGNFGDKINLRLMNYFRKHIDKKYSHIKETDRKSMFSVEVNVSRTHPGNMQKKILEAYSQKLRQYNLSEKIIYFSDK
ncbi:MAG: nucleotidyltransferase domain-containing protein [Ignavibacteria bacterium]|nr:nucleotidyltransferase domain-containing protein [Ignavibacteria bacterium]